MKKPIYLLLASLTLVLSQSCKKKTADSDPTPAVVTDNNASTPRVWKTLNGQPTLVIGHRGYAGLRPDHTIAGYILAIEKGADFVEPDLVMTKDSILVCRHEPMLSGTTNVKDHPEFKSYKTKKFLDGDSITDWFVCDFTLAEIKTLRAIQPLSAAPSSRSVLFDGMFSIPTFQEMIEVVKSENSARGRVVGIYPETKHPTFHESRDLHITDKVLEVLQKNGWNNADAPVYLQSFEVSNLQYARTKSTVKIVQLIDADDVDNEGNITLAPPYDKPYDFAKAGDSRTFKYLTTNEGLDFVKTYANGIGPWKPYIIPYKNNTKERLTPTDLIQRAHARNLVVHAYTFRKEPFRLLKDYNGDFQAELKDFYDLGLDGLFTDFTEDAVTARK